MNNSKSPSRDKHSDGPASTAAASLISISKAFFSASGSGGTHTPNANTMNILARKTSTTSRRFDTSSGFSQSSSDIDDKDFNDASSSLSECPDDDSGSRAEEQSSGPLKKRKTRSNGADFPFARSSFISTAITSSAATNDNDNDSTFASKRNNERITLSAPSKQTKKSREPVKVYRELRPAPYYFYIDHSREVDEDILAPLSSPLCTPNFVIKLHAILIREDVKNTIAWIPHGRAWKVIDQDEFQARILPHYFMQSNIASFHRQANGWGFRRILKGPDKGAFYNEYFLRAVPHLCKKMKRVGGAKTIEDANSSHEPNLWMISNEHPLPKTLPHDDMNYVALKIINECIAEGGPKAKMPFIHDIQNNVAEHANNIMSSPGVHSASSIAASARAFTHTVSENKTASPSSDSEPGIDNGHSGNNGSSSSRRHSSTATLAASRHEVNFTSHGSNDAVQPINTLESLAKLILQQSEVASRNDQGRIPIGNGKGGQSDLHSPAMSQFTQSVLGNMNLGEYQQLQGRQQHQQQQQQQEQPSITVQDLLNLIGRNSNSISTAPQNITHQNLQLPSINIDQQLQVLASSAQEVSNSQNLVGMTSRAALHQDQSGRQRSRPSDICTEIASQTQLQIDRQENIGGIINSMLDQRIHLHQNQNQEANVFQNGNSQMQHQSTSRILIPPAVASFHGNQQEQDYQSRNDTIRTLLHHIQNLQHQNLGGSQIQGSSSLPGQSQSQLPRSHAMASSISDGVPVNLRDLVTEAILTGIRIGSDYDTGPVPRNPRGQQQNNELQQQQQPRNNPNFGPPN